MAASSYSTNGYVLCVFVEISPNYFEEIEDHMDYYIIQDDLNQSGYDGDVSFNSSSTTRMSEYTLGSDTTDSGLQESPESSDYIPESPTNSPQSPPYQPDLPESSGYGLVSPFYNIAHSPGYCLQSPAYPAEYTSPAFGMAITSV